MCLRPAPLQGFTHPIYRRPHRIESENEFVAPIMNRAAADEAPSVSASTSIERGRIAYFALDLPHKGQASYVHIHEIVDNLRRLGWRVDLFAPRAGSPDQRRSAVAKTYEYLRTTRQALKGLASCDVLYVRAHALAWPVAMAARLRGRVLVEEVNGTELD